MSYSITQQIKDKATDIGFEKIGITKAVTTNDEKERLEEWINNKNNDSDLEIKAGDGDDDDEIIDDRVLPLIAPDYDLEVPAEDDFSIL